MRPPPDTFLLILAHKSVDFQIVPHVAAQEPGALGRETSLLVSTGLAEVGLLWLLNRLKVSHPYYGLNSQQNFNRYAREKQRTYRSIVGIRQRTAT